MAPSILQLEVTRLGTLIRLVGAELGVRNALVRARFELQQFILCVTEAEKERVSDACIAHLHAALLSLSPLNFEAQAEAAEMLNYIVNRLTYVNKRIPLIY